MSIAPEDLPFAVSEARLPLPALAELQDQLLMASTDLDRLQQLLADAVEQLIGRFVAANERLGALERLEPPASGASSVPDDAGVQAVAAELRADVASAITALQFQDMSTQLIGHALKRIHAVADYLGASVDADEGDGVAVQLETRPCPVAQRQMDAGSVELF